MRNQLLAMSFQFIDNSAIDQQSRKLIRSHVMKGRNLGKTVYRPSKRPSIKSKAAEKVQPTHGVSNKEDISCHNTGESGHMVTRQSWEESILAVHSMVGHGFSSVRLPIEPKPYMRRILCQFFNMIEESLYPPALCLYQNRSHWFQAIITDETFLHCTLAIGAACADSFYSFKGNDSLEATMHMIKAFGLLNQKLSGPEAVSDEVLASVVSLSIHDQMRGYYDTGRVHLEGLVRIVALRGGMGRIDRVELVQKICRTDIDVALHDGTPPRFRYQGLSGDRLHSVFGTRRKPTCLSDLEFEQPDYLLDCLVLDISTVANYLNENHVLDKLDPLIYQDVIIDLRYRLLQHSPLCGPRPSDPLQDAVHAGLTAFMTTFIIHFGRGRRTRFEALSFCLRHAVHQSWTLQEANRPFLLWTLVVGGITVLNSEDHIWLLPMMRSTALSLGIGNWEALQGRLFDYPWVKILHDGAAKELWDLAARMEPE